MSSAPDVSRAKRLARRAARPVTSPIDGRVADVNRRVGSAMRASMRCMRVSTRSLANSATMLTPRRRRRRMSVMRCAGWKTSLRGCVADGWRGDYRERLERARRFGLDALDADLAALAQHCRGTPGASPRRQICGSTRRSPSSSRLARRGSAMSTSASWRFRSLWLPCSDSTLLLGSWILAARRARFRCPPRRLVTK